MQVVIEHSPEELVELFLFATHRIDSDYIQKDLGIGAMTVLKAGAQAIGQQLVKFKKGATQEGDPGTHLAKKKATQKSMVSMFSKKVDGSRYTVRIFTSFLQFNLLS